MTLPPHDSNPYQAPARDPASPQGAPYGTYPEPYDGIRPPMPGTVIAVVVLISIIGLMMLANIIVKPAVGVVQVVVTVSVLVGVIKGRSWARRMAMVIAGMVAVLMVIAAFTILGMNSPYGGQLAYIAMVALLVQVPLNVAILVLLNTSSAKAFFVL